MTPFRKQVPMDIDLEQIRSFRLHSHHLDQKLPLADLEEAAGACGLQNSPPGAFETALWNRLDGCNLSDLTEALYRKKTLLQAWSLRGVPLVFPSSQSGIYLTPLKAREEEQPWIYTRGITWALDHLAMGFDDLLPLVKTAASYLDFHTITSKEKLDQILAGLVEQELPEEKRLLWNSPSMYGRPDRQTVGEVAVSFLLRPCSFHSLVVFGERQGISPTFTSYQNWLGRGPSPIPEGEAMLVRKFLHCFGPTTLQAFQSWLGCCPSQAKRLWNLVKEEQIPISVQGKTSYLLASDREPLLSAGPCGDRLFLLGAHDPYLDQKDRNILLSPPLHKEVWKTVSNPGAVLKRGRIVGIWKTKTQKEKLELSITLFEPFTSSEQRRLCFLAEEYGTFRQLTLNKCIIQNP